MKIIITILFMISTLFASAQQNNIATGSKKITGVITDNEGRPIPGVDVMIEGTNKSVLTDFDGNYTINAKEDEKLVASFNGMAKETIIIKKQTTINFKLREDPALIEKIVREAYEKTTRKIASAASCGFVGRPNEKFINMLRGNINTEAEHPQTNGPLVIAYSGSINGDPEPLCYRWCSTECRQFQTIKPR